jgi:hypothetical protein
MANPFTKTASARNSMLSSQQPPAVPNSSPSNGPNCWVKLPGDQKVFGRQSQRNWVSCCRCKNSLEELGRRWQKILLEVAAEKWITWSHFSSRETPPHDKSRCCPIRCSRSNRRWCPIPTISSSEAPLAQTD